MSEANEVTEIVERVREHLAAAVGIGHPDEKGYINFLAEILAALTAATERAEAAEAEREALRKDVKRLREAIDTFISFQGSTRELEGQAALNAAMAVQPTTGGGA